MSIRGDPPFLLTGCHRNEIVRLRWSESQDDTLVSTGRKVGPRTLPLNARARAILDRRPQGESLFVFPSPRNPSQPYGDHLSLWNRAHRKADIEDCRLHDLRYSCAAISTKYLFLLIIFSISPNPSSYGHRIEQ